MAYKDYNLIITNNSIKIQSEIDGYEVMNYWEHPLMKKHADVVTQFGGNILEIGFGMGISADYIQSNNIKSHTIVEIHPQVIGELDRWSKDKSNVKVIEGDWYERVEEICSKEYDGIFFDTHMDRNVTIFNDLIVKRCLKKGGVFTWFSPRGNFLNWEGVICESVIVNPENCSYYDLNSAFCPYYISS